MHVQDLKRWHWVAIALVVGLALSYAWSSVDWDENLPTIGQREFEAGLTLPLEAQGHLKNVTVMPPGDGAHKVIVEQVRHTSTPGDRVRRAFRAEIPYKAGAWSGEAEAFADVLAYLARVRETSPEVNYSYAWYRETWAVYLLWTGASVLLIGGIWPSVVSLMVGAGLGLRREDPGPEYDLDRFKGEATAGGAMRDPTPEQLAHMRQLEEELERQLEAQRLGMPTPEDQPAGVGAAEAPRALDGGPLEPSALDQAAKEHDYKGEFYPVDRHLPRKSSQ